MICLIEMSTFTKLHKGTCFFEFVNHLIAYFFLCHNKLMSCSCSLDPIY